MGRKKQKNLATTAKKPVTLVIGIASSALFNLQESDNVFRSQGIAAYEKYQLKNEEKTLDPGYAFPLIKKILDINRYLVETHKLEAPVMEVVLLSRNSANTGLRVFNSIEKHRLEIYKAAFCSGTSPHIYAPPFGCKLFLSKNAEDVHNCIENGLAAARIEGAQDNADKDKQLKFAFDGDAVLFSDEAEKITENKGVAAFLKSEKRNANRQLGAGPFKPFLEALGEIQRRYFPEDPSGMQTDREYDIHTALVTARAAPSHKRAIHTLRQWEIIPNECLFVGDNKKGGFLKAFGADIFFDDKEEHCESANSKGTPSGHVPRLNSGAKSGLS